MKAAPVISSANPPASAASTAASGTEKLLPPPPTLGAASGARVASLPTSERIPPLNRAGLAGRRRVRGERGDCARLSARRGVGHHVDAAVGDRRLDGARPTVGRNAGSGRGVRGVRPSVRRNSGIGRRGGRAGSRRVGREARHCAGNAGGGRVRGDARDRGCGSPARAAVAQCLSLDAAPAKPAAAVAAATVITRAFSRKPWPRHPDRRASARARPGRTRR